MLNTIFNFLYLVTTDTLGYDGTSKQQYAFWFRLISVFNNELDGERFVRAHSHQKQTPRDATAKKKLREHAQYRSLS